VTRADRIGLAWTAPTFNGGSVILDYRVWFDNASGATINQVNEQSVTDISFTVLSLTQGSTY